MKSKLWLFQVNSSRETWFLSQSCVPLVRIWRNVTGATMRDQLHLHCPPTILWASLCLENCRTHTLSHLTTRIFTGNFSSTRKCELCYLFLYGLCELGYFISLWIDLVRAIRVPFDLGIGRNFSLHHRFVHTGFSVHWTSHSVDNRGNGV
jgi:hypothetical protein